MKANRTEALVTRKRPTVALVFLIICCFPLAGHCCEPILPLCQLLAGSSLAGPVVLTQSLVWLFLAVAIKCGGFVALERRLTLSRAVLFMVVANVISTIPGALIAALAGSGTFPGLILALPIVFALGWIVQRRVVHFPPSTRPRHISGAVAMLCFVGFFVVSVAIYALADAVLDNHNYATYWILKFLFVTLVACTGIVISVVLEESVIARLARRSLGDLSFYGSVFRANYITLGVVLLVAAIKMMPKRLDSPHFIVSWIQSLLIATGLG